MANLNLKEVLDRSLRTTKQYIDQEDEKKIDKIENVDLYALLNEIFSGVENSSFGYVDANNNILLNDDLVGGVYTIKYLYEDGTESFISDFTVEENKSGGE